jgi:hypothetical protein
LTKGYGHEPAHCCGKRPRARSGGCAGRQDFSRARGVNSLNYNLYADPARSIVFGDGTAGTQTITRPLNGLLIFGQSLSLLRKGSRKAMGEGRNLYRQHRYYSDLPRCGVNPEGAIKIDLAVNLQTRLIPDR